MPVGPTPGASVGGPLVGRTNVTRRSSGHRPPHARPSHLRYTSPMPPRDSLFLLRGALGLLQLLPRASELRLLHRWLDSWAGIGLIAIATQRLGYETEVPTLPAGVAGERPQGRRRPRHRERPGTDAVGSTVGGGVGGGERARMIE
jgi:hypothetical protein